MHYFTKEWYELCQKTSAHFGLEEDEKAGSYSDEYFQELYKQRLKDYIHLQEEITSNYKTDKGSSSEHTPFDSQKLSEQFYQAFLLNQEHIKKILPEEIFVKIADIRVYILRKATRQMIEDVTQFCQNNRKLMITTIEEYKKYYKKALESLDKSVLEKINFHDCTVIGKEQTAKTLTVLFDNLGGFTNVTKMHLDNYEIIQQDALLQNSWWLYDEIYKTNGKYELHVLLQNGNMGLIEFIVSAENISFEQTEK